MPTTLPSDPFAALGGWLSVATLATLVLGAGLLLWGPSVHRALVMGVSAAAGALLGGPLAGHFGLETWAGWLIGAAALGLLGYLLARVIWSLAAGGLLAVAAAAALALMPPGLTSSTTSPASPPVGGAEAAPVPVAAPPPAAPVAAAQSMPQLSVWELATRLGRFVRAMEDPRILRPNERELWAAMGLDDLLLQAKAHGVMLGIVMLGAGAAGLVGGFLLPRFTVIVLTAILGSALLATAAAVACGLWLSNVVERRPDNYLALDGVWLGVLLVGLIFQGVCEYRSRRPARAEEEGGGEGKPPKPAKGAKSGKKEE